MNMLQAIESCVTKYFSVDGRAARSEYWFWVLFVMLVSIVLRMADFFAFHVGFHDPHALAPLTVLWKVIVFIPGIAVGVRRLHDTDRSGWWMLIALTIIGIIPLVIWYCTPGAGGGNRFGENPLP